MKDKVYITGHRSPDTDSICSALAYAELKNRMGDVEAIPIRIGELNQETRFVLDRFGVDAPIYMDSMQPKLQDLKIDHAYGISPETSLHKASQIIQENHLNNLAIVDEKQELVGVISLSNITKSYANVWDDTILGRSQTSLENILEVLSAKALYRPKKARRWVGSMTVHAMGHVDKDIIEENDICLVGNRKEAQEYAIGIGVAILVLTNGSKLDSSLKEACEKNGVTVISTELSTFMAARILPQAVPVRFLMTSEGLVAFHTSDYMDVVQEKMASTRFRSYPVLDSNNHVVGSISRYHLINTEKKKLIMVDHNERSQSIQDLDRADILEIIDHHRVANVTTAQPIMFRNMPVGCTATIISQMFFEQGIRPSREAAGLMASAIISDTLLFRSPTSTELDRLALDRLAVIAGIHPEEYAMEMFQAGTDLSGKKPNEILTEDAKFFNIEGVKTKVAQVFTMNLESLNGLRQALLTRMKELLNEQNEDIYLLVMTDIFKENSYLLHVGSYGQAIAQEFGKSLVEYGFLAEGVLSRKKQIVPKLTAAISRAQQGKTE